MMRDRPEKIRWRRQRILLMSMLCCLLPALCSGAGAAEPAVKTKYPVEPEGEIMEIQNHDLELLEKWGIEITTLRLAAAGYMVDFRFRVLDPEKAAALFRRETIPFLIDQASGKVLSVPNMAKVGPLRTSEPPKENRIYWMFFRSVPGLVKPGSRITVAIGDFRAENLVVR